MQNDVIDFVVITVDGNDPVWRKKKNEYLGIEEGDDRDIRYRDWENLKYWFRSVEKFAPWVHKVYLVTDHQAPDWVDDTYEKLVLVNHDEFIPKKYLPTFSSHPIEHNIFRIDGLSEQFVYFNDDMFLLQPVKSTDFFRNGLPRDYAIEAPITVHDRMFAHIIANNELMLNRNYDRKEVLKKQRKKFYSPVNMKGMAENLMFKPLKRRRFFGFKNAHMPSCILKSTCKAVWETNYEWLDETCKDRFRGDNNVNQYIYIEYQYVNGLFDPINWKNKRHLYRVNDRNLNTIANAIRSQRYAMVCINEAHDLNFDLAKMAINDAWETLLPDKSKFEK